MFIPLRHTKLNVYTVASDLLLECYKIMLLLPEQEKFNLCSQVRRAALSVKLNIAEGSTRKSSIERKRFYEIARGSVVELDAALEVAIHLGYFSIDKAEKVGQLLNSSFSMLSKMIAYKETK
jgi:four helix bundle protein